MGCSSSGSHLGSTDRQTTKMALPGPAFPAQGSPEHSRSAVAISSERSQKIESIVRVVLEAHGFVPPVIIEGQDAVKWAVSTRPGSNRELVLASVKMGPENEALVELFPYAHIGSTWALLGHKFRGLMDEEEREMNNQIRERLVR